jgi:hypothetical protein
MSCQSTGLLTRSAVFRIAGITLRRLLFYDENAILRFSGYNAVMNNILIFNMKY